MNTKKAIMKFDSKSESNAIAAIKQLPPKPPTQLKSAREVIVGMADLIRTRIASGYTYQQIVEALASAGISVSAGTLRAYLSLTRETQSRQKRSKVATDTKSFAAKEVAKNAAPVQRDATQTHRAFQDPDEK